MVIRNTEGASVSANMGHNHFNCGSRLREGLHLLDLHHSSITHVESLCLTTFVLKRSACTLFHTYMRNICALLSLCYPSNTITTVICLKPQECLYPLIFFSCRKQLARAHYLVDRASHITIS